jgi:hypothetical protein
VSVTSWSNTLVRTPAPVPGCGSVDSFQTPKKIISIKMLSFVSNAQNKALRSQRAGWKSMAWSNVIIHHYRDERVEIWFDCSGYLSSKCMRRSIELLKEIRVKEEKQSFIIASRLQITTDRSKKKRVSKSQFLEIGYMGTSTRESNYPKSKVDPKEFCSRFKYLLQPFFIVNE